MENLEERTEKCEWKKMFENPNSTSGNGMKKYRERCLKCDGTKEDAAKINCNEYYCRK